MANFLAIIGLNLLSAAILTNGGVNQADLERLLPDRHEVRICGERALVHL